MITCIALRDDTLEIEMLTDLTVELNQACPNRCLFCSSLATPDSDHVIDRVTVNRIARQAASLGLRDISLSGGEPLEHPELREVLSDLKDIGLAVHLYTTGIGKQDGLVQTFTGWADTVASLSSVIFNVQSTEACVHDELVGRTGALSLTLASMRAAQKAGCRVEVHIVPNHINIQSIEKTVRDVWATGVTQISLLRLVRQGYARNNAHRLELTPRDLVILRLAATSLQEEGVRLRLGIPFSGIFGPRVICNAGLSKLIIRYDGRVFPCEAFKDRPEFEFSLGDIRRDNLVDMLHRGRRSIPLARLRSRLFERETCPAQLV